MVKFSSKLVCVDPKYPSTAFAIVPAKVINGLGGGGRIPIAGKVNGFEFRTTIVTMWGKQLFCVNAAMRDGGKAAVGKVAKFEVERDDKPRTVNVPADVKKTLGKELLERFEAMSYSHRKEWVVAIEQAKKAETRAARIGKLVKAMRERRG